MSPVVVILFVGLLLVVVVGAAVGLYKITKKHERIEKQWDKDRTYMEQRVEALQRYEPIEAIDAEVQKRKRWIKKKTEETEQEVRRKIEDSEGQVTARWLQIDQEIQKRHLDTDREVTSRINTANQREQEVEEIIKKERKETLADVREKKKKAEELLEDAQTRSYKIIEQANVKAKEVAGDALDALNNARMYEATAASMRHQIEGYGDEYLIPNHTVLDDLAEEWGHKEAGQELKKCREQIKRIVKQQLAADCDYVEKKRRETAMDFVLDAFNGKAEAIISRAKHDNYGKLRQQLIEAAHLVNFHGQAFRNARVRPEFLELRQEELKWLVSVNELKRKEREQQREFKEWLREEEKARKEAEKAQREAAKEKKMLDEAMAKARAKFESAGEKERAKFEKELADLQGRLQEAEEKNQRALSMAQQTKRGHVYIISNIGSFGEEVFKVGMTRRLEPMDRIKELGDASVPFSFDVHAMILSDDAPGLENKLHHLLNEKRVNRVNLRKEFFYSSAKELRELVEAEGLEVHWSMKAEAMEYRESVAMRKRESEEMVGA